MLKKIITTALISGSMLGVMAANAAESGVYITGQLGYAINNGLHAGIPGIPTYPSGILPPGTDPKTSTLGIPGNLVSGNPISNGIAERLALGYKINNNLAMEVGFLNLKNGNFNGSIKYNLNVFGFDKRISGTVSSKQSAIDIAAKGILPVAEKFNVYGKVGVAYLTTRLQGKSVLENSIVSPEVKPTVIASATKDVTQHNWAPEVAIGVSYDLTPNVSVDTSITHIQPMGSNHPGSINFMAVGLGYNFG